MQEKLPELRQHFPDLAKSLEAALQPPPMSPAAALHGAQAKAQKAYKTLQSAERIAIDLEKEAADLVTKLRGKVADMQEARTVLSEARDMYDKAAAAAKT